MQGARTNPFSMDCLERLPFLFQDPDIPGWPELLDRLRHLNFRAAVVGCHGSGKTQLIRELHSQLQDAGFRVHPIFLNAQNRTYDLPPAFEWSDRDIILLDGAEQLSYWKWRTFCHRTRPARGLVITGHTPGRLPTLYRCQASLDLLLTLLIRLGVPEPDRQLASRLFTTHGSNLRDTLRAYYDLAADGVCLAAADSPGAIVPSPDHLDAVPPCTEILPIP